MKKLRQFDRALSIIFHVSMTQLNPLTCMLYILLLLTVQIALVAGPLVLCTCIDVGLFRQDLPTCSMSLVGMVK
jgi:hypothetical protein